MYMMPKTQVLQQICKLSRSAGSTKVLQILFNMAYYAMYVRKGELETLFQANVNICRNVLVFSLVFQSPISNK